MPKNIKFQSGTCSPKELLVEALRIPRDRIRLSDLKAFCKANHLDWEREHLRMAQLGCTRKELNQFMASAHKNLLVELLQGKL